MRITDNAEHLRAFDRAITERWISPSERDCVLIQGGILVEVTTAEDELRDVFVGPNQVTTVGDEIIAKKFASVAVTAPTGMRLGTGTTAVAKSGAGSHIVTLISASTPSKALDGSFPTAASKGGDNGWRTQWKVSWTAGQATSDDIAEVVLTNAHGSADAESNSAARALISPARDVASTDSIAVTWSIDISG